ncbi:hypothetical protein F5Y17DRAFT_428867 [Xylariaceae sp. FL0594]|nr:hypothetical protein F5Y17DRAFT_428867 [Xylariaceae sp. FL0594]
MKRILFSFTVVFCFGPEAEHITASMLQEGEGPSTSGAENGDNVKSGPLFVVFLSKNGPIGKEDEANALREELLEWFNGTGAIDRLRIVERCGEKVLKDADLKKKAINQGCKAFGQEMKIVDETGAGHVVNEIGRLKDTIHAMDADGIFTMAWEVVLSHEGVVSNLYSKLDAAPSDSSKKKNFEAMKACLDALEDLALLGRAHQNLTLFKDTLGRLNAKLEIQFVDIDPVDHVPVAQIREEIKNITEEFQIPPNLVDARKEWANIEHLQRMHGEVKLLTHLNTAMTPLERAQMWRFIACNKKPCYGCFYLVRDAQGYGSEASHYKVFYPWPVPAELARTAGYLDGVRQLISRFEDIIRKACEENDFQQNPPIREMRSGMLSPRNM